MKLNGVRSTNVIGNAYAVLFTISRQPRTIRDLMDLLGLKREQVARFIIAAEQEGIVGCVGEVRQGKAGPASKVYGMTL